jgi:acetyl-CoA/propionyl-CoA carboxylase biotin carboxyl carrier protein
MLSKLIVTGATREQALQRSRRALEEMVVEGIPTVIPFDLAVVTDPDFAPADGPFKVHTRWIETEFVNNIPAWTASGAGTETPDAGERQRVVVEVGGKRLEVVLPSGLGAGAAAVSSGPGTKSGKSKKRSRSAGATAAAAGGDALTSPMQGTIVKVAAADGDIVAEGDLIVVLEAMKMEQPLTAHKSGTVRGLAATAGETVAAGAVIATIED